MDDLLSTDDKIKQLMFKLNQLLPIVSIEPQYYVLMRRPTGEIDWGVSPEQRGIVDYIVLDADKIMIKAT